MTTSNLKLFSLIFSFILLCITAAGVGIAIAKDNLAMAAMCVVMSLILSFLTYGDYVEYKRIGGEDVRT